MKINADGINHDQSAAYRQGHFNSVKRVSVMNFPVKIRIVDNGFVVLKDGKEFVFNKIQDLCKFIENELAAK